MVIYQLHEYSGEYDYFCDRIIGSYLRRERAEEEEDKAMAKEKRMAERSKKCGSCPFLEKDFEKVHDLLSEYYCYCDESKLKNSEYGIECENYCSIWDEARFEIVEVEVEE